MNDIELNAKSDRELLIILVQKVNPLGIMVEKHDKTLYNNGWGLAAQVKGLLILVAAIWSIFIVLVVKAS